jgi:hypothetical protein
VAALQEPGIQIDNESLRHPSPVGWEYLNLTGDYTWQTTKGTRQIRVILYAKEPSFRYLGVRGITLVMFPREQLKRAATLSEEDFVQLGKCLRPRNRLGFAYQVAFVRHLQSLPAAAALRALRRTGLL